MKLSASRDEHRHTHCLEELYRCLRSYVGYDRGSVELSQSGLASYSWLYSASKTYLISRVSGHSNRDRLNSQK